MKKAKNKCPHKKVSYVGRQQTLKPDIYLYLFNCDLCHTTLSTKSINIKNEQKS